MLIRVQRVIMKCKPCEQRTSWDIDMLIEDHPGIQTCLQVTIPGYRHVQRGPLWDIDKWIEDHIRIMTLRTITAMHMTLWDHLRISTRVQRTHVWIFYTGLSQDLEGRFIFYGDNPRIWTRILESIMESLSPDLNILTTVLSKDHPQTQTCTSGSFMRANARNETRVLRFFPQGYPVLQNHVQCVDIEEGGGGYETLVKFLK